MLVSLLQHTIGREETLTGRSGIWAKFLPYAMEEPLIGHGVGGFWTDKLVKSYKLNEAHNGYLDILLDYGFVGLVFFSLFLLSSCQKAHKELLHDYHWGNFWICFLVMGVIYNVAEATIAFVNKRSDGSSSFSLCDFQDNSEP